MKTSSLALLLALQMASTMAYCSEAIPSAYVEAARAQGIPSDILYVVAQQESNTRLNIGYYPWPWTLNVAGKAMYFNSRVEACQALVSAIRTNGEFKVDIGLTQQNWGYVGRRHYGQPCDALNPYDNLRVGAIELRKCYEARGNWIEAAGCYHRPAGGEPARKYRAFVQERLQRLKSPLGSSAERVADR